MTAIASLLTAAAILAAFRLPALMMFRGIRSPFAFRRPVVIVRMPAPISRSMPIASIPQQSTLSTLAPPLSVTLPQRVSWPLPPFPLPQFSPPSLSRVEQPPLNFTPQPTHFKPVLVVPTPHQNLNHEIRVTSINNRPFYRHYPKYHLPLSTTPKPELPFHYVFRPLNQANKKWKTPREYFSMSTTTVSNNHLNNNEERRYGMMFPMNPRHFKSDTITDENTTTTPPKTETTTQTTISTTSHQRVTTPTKVRLKSMTKSFKDKNIGNNNSSDNSMQTNQIKMLTSIPNMMSNKTRIAVKRIRIKTTIPTESTVMTPAPIENYKPVKARVTEHKINEIMKQLMFDDTKNLYYYVTLRSI